jgi:DNA-binding response OmpR family regulator
MQTQGSATSSSVEERFDAGFIGLPWLGVRGAQAQETAACAPSFQVQRILLVEDDLSLASLEAELLTAHGYVVVVAQSGELALALLQHALPDLVVLDVQLRGHVSGWEVLRDLRRQAMVPVLLTSSEPDVRAHLRSSGETRSTLDHLPKPYAMHALLRRVERLLTPGTG